MDRMVREFAVEVEWVPFELHPEIPPQGETRGTAIPSRSGVPDRLRALTEADGLPMRPNPVRANGHKALEAAEWAREQGPDAFDEVHRALFHAYFAAAANISTVDQVDAALGGTSIDRADLREALEGGRYRAVVDEYTQLARENGITATPTFLLGDKFVISGAQDWPVFESVLTRLGVPRRAAAEPESRPGAAPPLIDPTNID